MNEHQTKIAFLSTYPPRECGLATFTEDLVTAMDALDTVETSVMAVTKNESYANPKVQFRLQQDERANYPEAAAWANSHADLLVIEHEYGIFGGLNGDYILDLAEALTIPFIVTLHTILKGPTDAQKSILQKLGRLSSAMVSMSTSSIPLLTEIYQIPADKIAFIPHGVPYLQMPSREQLKSFYPGLKGRTIISSFGLISPAKGLEYGIRAIAKVIEQHPDVLYLILGKTHPEIKKRSGEAYRKSLLKLAAKLGVSDHVRFVDKYLTKKELISYLQASDIYLTPYISAEQAVSGTLAYAIGYGRAVVSTPYRYAQEMLGNGRGLLGEFKDADSLASCIRLILDNPVEKAAMERKTLKLGAAMTWENVADRYQKLCQEHVQVKRTGRAKKQAERHGAKIYAFDRPTDSKQKVTL